jgi:hypothetical protein
MSRTGLSRNICTLHDLIQAAEAGCPGHTALVDKNRRITYSELAGGPHALPHFSSPPESSGWTGSCATFHMETRRVVGIEKPSLPASRTILMDALTLPESRVDSGPVIGNDLDLINYMLSLPPPRRDGRTTVSFHPSPYSGTTERIASRCLA